MKRRLALVALLLLWALPASSQGPGLFVRTDCLTITGRVPGETWCFDATAQSVKVWNGAAFVVATAFSPPVLSSQGGTGLDTSGSTGIPKVVAGTWTTPTLVGVADGGTNQSAYAAKGDVLVSSGTTTLTKVAVGANGTVFTADSSQATGVGWAIPGGSYSVRNLVGNNNAGTPNTQFDYSADLVVLRSSANGGLVVQTNTGTLTNDTSVAGSTANGRDQLGAYASSIWIHFYFIWSGSTLATLSSTVAPPTGPTLPSGYTHWAYAGAVRYNGTPLLVKTRMRGAWMYYEGAQTALSGGAATSETAIDLTTFVPPAASMIQAEADAANSELTSSRTLLLRYVTTVNYADVICANAIATVATQYNTLIFMLPNLAQNLYYLWTGANATVNIYIHGYKVANGGE